MMARSADVDDATRDELVALRDVIPSTVLSCTYGLWDEPDNTGEKTMRIRNLTSQVLEADDGIRYPIEGYAPEPIEDTITECADGRVVYLADEDGGSDDPLSDLHGVTTWRELTELERESLRADSYPAPDDGEYLVAVHSERGQTTAHVCQYETLPDFDDSGWGDTVDPDSLTPWPTHVLALDVDWTDPDTAASGLIYHWTLWASGEIYGIVELTPVGNRYEISDSVWGLVGWESAREELASWAGPAIPTGDPATV